MEEFQKTNNAVIYCRVSTKEQVEEGNSLTTQEKNCREYAIKNNYNVLKVFIEQGESAKTADRTELQNLLTFCTDRKNKVNAVIIYKIDRLSRNTDDYSYLRIALKSKGVEIKSTSEFFENTPAGRFMENIIANVAQFDNDVRTERSVGGMKQAVMEGRFVWLAPLGYINTKVDGKSNIAPTEKAKFIKEAFEEFARGIYTVREVQQKMALRGFKVSRTRFYIMLKNEVYAGWIKKLGIRVKGTFTPIISDELFSEVQRRIKSPKVHRFYAIEHPDFPLRRFVSTTEGEKLTGSWSQGKLRKYAYYRFRLCKREFRKSFLHAAFMEFLNQFAFPTDRFPELVPRINSYLSKDAKKNETAIKSCLQRQKELRERKQYLIDKGLKGIIGDGTLKEQLHLIEADLWKVRQSIESLSSESSSLNVSLERFRDFLTRPGQFWLEQPIHIKRKLQVFEFPKGVTFDGKTFRTPEICSLFKIKDLFLGQQSCVADYSISNTEHHNRVLSPALQKKKLIASLPEVQLALTELDTILNSSPTHFTHSPPEIFKLFTDKAG